MPGKVPEEERRTDPGDGQLYTKQQFQHFYGEEDGLRRWRSAAEAFSAGAVEEKLQDDNGQFYTKREFVACYGDTTKWDALAALADMRASVERRVPPPSEVTPACGAGDDLIRWLHGNALAHLNEVFQQQAIETLDDAFALTEEDLIEMEITPGDCSAFLRALPGAAGSPTASSPSEVDLWLDSLGFGQHASVFLENEILTLQQVKDLNAADLKEMFQAIGTRKRIASAVQKLKTDGSLADGPGSASSLATAMSEPPCQRAFQSPPPRQSPPPSQSPTPRQSPPPRQSPSPSQSPTPPRTPRSAPGVQQQQRPALAKYVAPSAGVGFSYQQGGAHQWHGGEYQAAPQGSKGKGKGKGGLKGAWSQPQGPAYVGCGGKGLAYVEGWGVGIDDERGWGKGRGVGKGGKSGKGATDCPKSALRKTRICWDWQRGDCRYGASCGFAHGKDELGMPRQEIHARFQPEPAVFASDTSGSQEEPQPQARRQVPPKAVTVAVGPAGPAHRALPPGKAHADPAPQRSSTLPGSATAAKLQQLEEENRRLKEEKEKEHQRKEREKAEEIDRAVQLAILTKTEDRARKHKMRISDIASTYVATSDHKAVHRIMTKIGDMGNVVDVVFCMDGTGSMQRHIEAVRSNIVDISADLISACQLKSRVGIVVYRDYTDGDRRFETYDFMEPVEVQEALASVRATGGSDEAEDCIGGLAKVTELNWQAPARVCIWIADAPTHGSRFHDGAGDNYKGGDPDGRTPEKVLSIFNDKNIELIFLKINRSTDKMVRVFGEVLAGFQRELQEYPMADKDGLRSVLTESITASVSRTASRSGPTCATRKPFKLEPDFGWAAGHSCWGCKEKGTVYQLEAFEAEDVDSIIEVVVDGPHISDKPAKVCMTKDPAFKGELRLAYPCRMDGDWLWSSDKHLIAKESQYAAGKYNSKEFNLKEASIQLVACKFAQEWNKVFSDIEISFVSVRVIALQDRPRDHKYFQIEEYLPGKYHKWNNNNGYVSDVEAHPAMQTFSHWTYVRSKGLALVVDLQGVFTEERSWMGRTKPKYTLTDPAIHTGDPEKTMPSQTNLGRDGMARFFASHRCNDLCKHLKLPLPEGMPRATKEDVARAAAAPPGDAFSSFRPTKG